jgi:SpoVK/Ycf46/Vps4 family AAA+-type ATPase
LDDGERAAAFATMREALEAPEPPAPVHLDVLAGGRSGNGGRPGNGRDGSRGDGSRDSGSNSDIEVEAPTVRLSDVGGLEDVKRRLNTSFLGPMRNPELLAAFGKSLRGGMLLYGPPGCGKTFLARAVAGELGANFIAVGLHDVLNMWLGESQRRLHAIFEDARRSAPCVLFFDEVDAIGRKRSDARASGTRDVVVQLLAELDGIGNDNDGVFTLAATNHPWDVDSALRRPGRFDRTFFVPPPDAGAREAILRLHLHGRPHEITDVASLARRSHGASGADLAHVCETAVEYALEASIAAGAPRPVTAEDLDRAMAEVSWSTREWLQLSRNYAQFANEAGLYDDLVRFLRKEGLT